MNGELTRLEAADSGYEPLDRIGFAQTKIERFYAQYHKIPHPFGVTSSLQIALDDLNRAVRLLVYVERLLHRGVAVLITPSGERIELPKTVFEVLKTAVKFMSDGRAVTFHAQFQEPALP